LHVVAAIGSNPLPFGQINIARVCARIAAIKPRFSLGRPLDKDLQSPRIGDNS